MILRIAAVLLPLSGPAFAQALPVFSDTGPDAALFGADEGYPIGTRATLNQQQYMVGEYSHYDELLPARLVARAATPSPFERAPEELTLRYQHQGEWHTLDDYLERNPVTGLMIVRDRTILYEHYRYARTDRDRFTSQSMAKTILGMLIGIAVSEGSIGSIDDRASVYVPELEGTELGRTPIRALLHMASGIEFTERYDGQDDQAKMTRELFHAGSPGPAAVLREFDTRNAPPDTLFHYAGQNSELLGLVLTNATHEHPADYLASRIWSRIGTESDASWVMDASGQEATYCCFNAVLRDWARFGLLLANDGEWDGEQIIPREWVLDATTAAFRAGFRGYGYQVWTLPRPRRQFALIGIHGQEMLVLPAAKLVLVQTAVGPLPIGNPMSRELISLWTALVNEEGR
jgi:CubicO group peptidase (beta-lactamase class C family)